jgi:2-methylcitrate dehydratase PrpD
VHAYLDCALELRREHGLDADAVSAVECLVPAAEVPIVCEPRAAKVRPRTSYDAQFSLSYTVASALLDGRVGLDTFSADRLVEARRLSLAERVTHAIDDNSSFPKGFPGWVRVRLRDGRTLESRAPDGRGSLARPLPEDAILEKFRDNAERALSAARVTQIERAVLQLDALDDVRPLLALCRA